MNDIITLAKARTLFAEAHESIGQKRLYTAEPYTVHTSEVELIIALYCPGSPGRGTFRRILALGHDVLEDVFPKNPKYSPEWIEKEFGAEVRMGINALSDKYTKENYPTMNREKRKIEEAGRYLMMTTPKSEESPYTMEFVVDVHTVKVADIISNTSDITKHDKKFAKVYLDEADYLLDRLVAADRNLLKKAKEQVCFCSDVV